jgi:hypothetical protein
LELLDKLDFETSYIVARPSVGAAKAAFCLTAGPEEVIYIISVARVFRRHGSSQFWLECEEWNKNFC